MKAQETCAERARASSPLMWAVVPDLPARGFAHSPCSILQNVAENSLFLTTSSIACQAGLIHCLGQRAFRCPDTYCGWPRRGKDWEDSPRRVQAQEASVTFCWQSWTGWSAWVHLSTSQACSRVVKRPEIEIKLCLLGATWLSENHSVAVHLGSSYLIQAPGKPKIMCIAPGRYRGSKKTPIYFSWFFFSPRKPPYKLNNEV